MIFANKLSIERLETCSLRHWYSDPGARRKFSQEGAHAETRRESVASSQDSAQPVVAMDHAERGINQPDASS